VLGESLALGQNADSAADSLGILGAHSVHEEASRGRLKHRGEDAYGRRFPRAVGTEEAHYSTGLQREGQSPQRQSRPIGLLKVLGSQQGLGLRG